MHPPVEITLSGAELTLWSAAAGACATVLVLSLIDAITSGTRSAWESLTYTSSCAVLILLLSGLPAALWPTHQNWLHLFQVLGGPLCAAIGSFGASRLLFANRRDRPMRVILIVMTSMAMLGGPACLLLEPAYRLPTSAGIAIITMMVVLWLTVRAAQRGDDLAWAISLSCLLTLCAQIGLYQIALMKPRPDMAVQGATAALAVAALIAVALVVWLRGQQGRRLHNRDLSKRDPVTQLFTGTTMVQKIIASQRNRQRVGGHGALMAVMIFEQEQLLSQIGRTGIDLIYTELALRMQRHTGAINPAGRYYDRCFMVLFETLHSPRWLRTLSLRVAASLREPIEVRSLSGEMLLVTADIGVGITHIAASSIKHADQLLDEAQSTAQAARDMRSRAALLDQALYHAVPVESATLGSSWDAQAPRRKGRRRGRRGLDEGDTHLA